MSKAGRQRTVLLLDLSTTVLSQAILFVENVQGWWNDGRLDNNRLIQASDAARLTEELRILTL
jgi:hypothetical protein